MNHDFVNSITSNKLIFWNKKSIEIYKKVLLELLVDTFEIEKHFIEEVVSGFYLVYKDSYMHIGIYDKFIVFVGENAENTIEVYMEFCNKVKEL